jgi:phage shock protein C
MGKDKKLYRKRDDQVIAGVCSGLNEYFELGIDNSILRLIIVALSLFLGTGILLYLIAWAIIPLEPEKDE